MKKGTIITVLILLLIGAGFIYYKFFFVFGEGTKSGELNRFVHKGYIFKTYEGRIIQAGISASALPGSATSSIQSNEFIFSVSDDALADSLMRCSGKVVELSYKEYKGTLPWRGVSRYVVDGILSVKESANSRIMFGEY